MRRTRAALLAHCGKDASQIQHRLIDRAVMLSLYVARLDRRAVQAGVLSEHDSKTYLAYSNSLTRTLNALGVQPAARSTGSDFDLSGFGEDDAA